MKLIKYSIIGLFIISVVFVAGNSFAQRFDPFRAGLSPSEIEYFTKIYGMGRGTDPSVTPLTPYESATGQRFDPFRAGLSPSEIEYFTKIYGMGRGTDPSVIPLVEYGESGPTKVTVFGKVIHR
jgi:hypothetical protein